MEDLGASDEFERSLSPPTLYQGLEKRELPLDVDIAHEVVDLIRYDVRQCLFFGNHRLVVQGSHIQEGLYTRGRYQFTAVTPSERCADKMPTGLFIVVGILTVPIFGWHFVRIISTCFGILSES